MAKKSLASEGSGANHHVSRSIASIGRRLGVVFAWVCVSLLSAWCVAALYFDFPYAKLRLPGAIIYALFALAAVDRDWQADVSQTAWAEVNGDTVTIHNYRDCRNRTEFDYTCEWITKTVRLSELRGIDVAFIHWGLPNIAHLIVSFHFASDDYVAVSIEMRKQAGQSYSAIRGFFRQYTLTYIFAGESDLIRLRSNFRQGEEVDLFRTTADPEYSRKLFLQYLRRANELHQRPEWYNALTSNCTTNVFSQMRAIGPLPSGISHFDLRVLLSGDADEMLYDHGLLAGNLPFPQLREQAHINATARAAGNSPDFSRVIRAGRAGFESQPN
jgi:hypothetical protein